MFRIFCLVIFCMVLKANGDMITRQKILMGTFVTISIEDKHRELIEPVFILLKHIEASLSSYNKNSPIFKLNMNKSAQLDNYSYEALKLSLGYYKETDSYFNIAVGKITKDLYRFGEEERIVSKKELQNASTSLSGLIFNKKEAIISDVIKIDLGGMGKGYAIDKVTHFLKDKGNMKAVIALSGDIRCIGRCYIGVQNPFEENKILANFYLDNSAVSTSGNYRRFIYSKEYNHLINPKTKISENNFASVTLISDKLSSATLDAYATAVSVMPPQTAYDFLKKQKLAYIVLQTDKQLLISSNIQHYVENLKLK